MFTKLKALYRVFTIGQTVANPAAWKRGQITAAMLASIMGAALTIAKTFGVELPLSDADLLQLGGAVITVYGVLSSGVTIASTDKLGLPAPEQPTGTVIATSQQIVSAAIPKVPRPRRTARNGDAIDDTRRLE